MKILFLGKLNDPRTLKAAELVKKQGFQTDFIFGKFGDPKPEIFSNWKGDLVVSYLSPWVVPKPVLESAQMAAINFHPGPPEYPGIGCTNFALYHQEKVFGVTCHHMNPKVDTGGIIEVRRFFVSESETVQTLTEKCYAEIEFLFAKIFSLITKLEGLPSSTESWTRVPYTRKELNELCRLTPEMSVDEVQRRVRAVTFPGKPGAYIEAFGYRFNLDKKVE